MAVRCATCGEEFDGDAMEKHLEVCQRANKFRLIKIKEKNRKAKKRLENLERKRRASEEVGKGPGSLTKRMVQNTDKNITKKRKKKVIRIVQKKVSDYV